MLVTSKEGKALLEKLALAKVGKDAGLDLASLLPALKIPCQAILTNSQIGSKYSELAVYWLGIRVCDIGIEVHGKDIFVEVI